MALYWENNLLQRIINMNREFQTVLKRKSTRQRFYSSMNYEEYCEIYGPPAPLCKPMEDPQDIPLFDLEAPSTVDPTPQDPPAAVPLLSTLKMDTIFEIECSENFTQNLQRSPRVELFSTNSKSREFSLGEALQQPKRMRVRMRSQSDNSEYLIFNFLERASEKGRKRVKLD